MPRGAVASSTYLEGGGRLNGEAPIAVHVEQKPGRSRILTSDATDAGSAFRLTGFYGSARGGTMNLRVNLDGGSGGEKPASSISSISRSWATRLWARWFPRLKGKGRA